MGANLDWRAIVDAAPCAVIVSNEAGLIDYCNRAARFRFDDPDRLVGRPVQDVIGDRREAAATRVALGHGVSVWYLAPAAVPPEVHLAPDARIAAEPQPAAEVRLASEARFASEVGEALAGNLNLRRTLAHIAELTVPTFGIWVSVVLLDADSVRYFTRWDRPRSGAETDDLLLPIRQVDAEPRRILREAIDGGHLDRRGVTDSVLRALGASPEAARELTGAGPVDLASVSFRASGTVEGALVVARPAGRSLPLGQLVVLARRGAVALAAARIYEERSKLASTLRSALLPAALPDAPGIRLGAVYRPAQETTEIGGDFYEVMADGDGWSFSIGDVCGKGVDAAVLTGQVRQSLRTVTLVDPDPAERLHLLNSTMLAIDGRSFVTAVHGIMHNRADRIDLEVAAGGHPPPWIRRADGSVEEVFVRGPIIGMLAGVQFRRVELSLRPGDTLVTYTDGLTDAHGPKGILGDEPLLRLLADCEGMTAQAVAERLLQMALEHLDGGPHDDMAILAVQPDLGGGRPGGGTASAGGVSARGASGLE